MYLLYLTNYEKYIKALSDQQLQERERESKRKRMKESGRVHERNYLYMYQILDLSNFIRPIKACVDLFLRSQ